MSSAAIRARHGHDGAFFRREFFGTCPTALCAEFDSRRIAIVLNTILDLSGRDIDDQPLLHHKFRALVSRARARVGRKSLHGLVPGLDIRARQIGDFDGAKPGLNARLYDATGFGRTATSVIWKVT
jgi:hypothetical protein